MKKSRTFPQGLWQGASGVISSETATFQSQKYTVGTARVTHLRCFPEENSGIDPHHVKVGKVLTDGVDANLEQIKRGMAWHYKAYEREQPATDRKVYADAEDAARAARRSLWSDAEPVAPWEFGI